MNEAYEAGRLSTMGEEYVGVDYERAYAKARQCIRRILVKVGEEEPTMREIDQTAPPGSLARVMMREYGDKM